MLLVEEMSKKSLTIIVYVAFIILNATFYKESSRVEKFSMS